MLHDAVRLLHCPKGNIPHFHTHFATVSFLFWTSVLTHFWTRSVPDSLLQMLQCLHASLVFDLHHDFIITLFLTHLHQIHCFLTQDSDCTYPVVQQHSVKHNNGQKDTILGNIFSHWPCLCLAHQKLLKTSYKEFVISSLLPCCYISIETSWIDPGSMLNIQLSALLIIISLAEKQPVKPSQKSGPVYFKTIYQLLFVSLPLKLTGPVIMCVPYKWSMLAYWPQLLHCQFQWILTIRYKTSLTSGNPHMMQASAWNVEKMTLRSPPYLSTMSRIRSTEVLRSR